MTSKLKEIPIFAVISPNSHIPKHFNRVISGPEKNKKSLLAIEWISLGYAATDKVKIPATF